jgi:hypothetical protein
MEDVSVMEVPVFISIFLRKKPGEAGTGPSRPSAGLLFLRQNAKEQK